MLTQNSNIAFLRKNLIQWFEKNKRDFPWRDPNCSNYQLIISEVLLQRTRAETVASFYRHFFEKYKSWEELANATLEELEEVLKSLGLFRRRALRLFKIAREFQKRNGNLPKTSRQLEDSNLGALYLKNAFELFVLKKRSPLLDVNMDRILERYLNGKNSSKNRPDRNMQAMARKIVNVNECKELNWAFLDYAAKICLSNNPKCLDCRLSKNCKYFDLSGKINFSKTRALTTKL